MCYSLWLYSIENLYSSIFVNFVMGHINYFYKYFKKHVPQMRSADDNYMRKYPQKRPRAGHVFVFYGIGMLLIALDKIINRYP
jgi:hypothetical protein